MNPYREAAPMPSCECATGELIDLVDDYDASYPVCRLCAYRQTMDAIERDNHNWLETNT